METALAQSPKRDDARAISQEFGPVGRLLASRYFEDVRFPPEAESELTRLSEQGFVVHVMRTTAWVNYLYLSWALIKRGLPPIRAVVNLRRWFTRPWRKTAQRGDFDVRFTYARRQRGSALVFLKKSAIGTARGKATREDPFPALVALTRKSDRPVFLVPELFVWEKWQQRLKPGIVDFLFGSPEAPGFLHSVLAFWRNYRRAQFRVGEPIDLQRFIAEHTNDPDAAIARKVRSALHHHLARQTRAVFGPPHKRWDRVIDEAMRDRVLRQTLEEIAHASQRKLDSLTSEARRDLKSIAARPSTTVVGLAAPILHWVFNRIYDGIEVDEQGLERAIKAAVRAPIVLCPSHKSHIDYLVMSYVLWRRGYSVPVVAAGANLSFFPLGPFFRRGGAFFLRRSFKGDKVYTAAFKAYIKKLVHDGVHQEFFPEGGRSRSGKLLMPKLGMLTWEVDAVLEGARSDLHFVPIAIDYEKVLESRNYSRELAGGEKKPEDIRSLLSAPKVLTSRYGRIHLRFDEPISLRDFMRRRGLAAEDGITDDQKKAMVRTLGNRIMRGIYQVSTITPHALVSAALLAHRGPGISARELSERIGLLRRIAEEESAPLSATLTNSPSDPTVFGPIQDAIRKFVDDEMIRTEEVKGEVIYTVEKERRLELAFYKNTLTNLVAPRSLVASALIASGPRASEREVKERALFLSRLFKFEFVYRVGVPFDALFTEALERLTRLGLALRGDQSLDVAPESHSRPQLTFLADLLRDYLESYRVAALTLQDLAKARSMDQKTFVRAALETGRGEYLAGRISAFEALSRPTLENAMLYLLDQRMLTEDAKKLRLGPAAPDGTGGAALAGRIDSFLSR